MLTKFLCRRRREKKGEEGRRREKKGEEGRRREKNKR
jgi:hypothetical protein